MAGLLTAPKLSYQFLWNYCAGDYQPVVIGANSNIQDGAYIGTANEYSPPAVLGDNVSVGHGAVIKGATVGDNSLIGINAVVSEGAQVSQASSCMPSMMKVRFAIIKSIL